MNICEPGRNALVNHSGNLPMQEITCPMWMGNHRYKGVASFLESRGIDIPFGDPSDDPEQETVCGLGNKKNIMFNEVLDEEGVEVYPIFRGNALWTEGSRCEDRCGLVQQELQAGSGKGRIACIYFETRVDGVVSAEIGLKGKPEPDIFTTACDNLGVEYHRSVVVEDAVSGVQAGRKGNFGLTLGMAREENIRELLCGWGRYCGGGYGRNRSGRDQCWFEKGMEKDGWFLKYHDYRSRIWSDRGKHCWLWEMDILEPGVPWRRAVPTK